MTKLVVFSLLFIYTASVGFWPISAGPRHNRTSGNKHGHSIKAHHAYMKHEKRQSSVNYLTMSETAPAGAVNVKSPSGLTAATGDGSTDDTSAIQAIFDHVATLSERKVYFPPGEYLISADVVIPPGDGFEIVGSEAGMSVIKTQDSLVQKVTMGNKDKVAQSNIVVMFLFFDGVRVQIGKKTADRSNIKVSHCVFFSRKEPGPGANMNEGQLRFQFISDSVALDYSVFLRGSNCFGVAAATFRTKEIGVENNIFGMDLGQLDWLDSELEDDYWKDLKPKLHFLKTHYTLPPDQGYFQSSIYVQYDRNMTINDNIFDGSPNFVREGDVVKKDHVIYCKGFNGVKIVQNYARGWPSDSSGGIKARNGQNIVIARNYIDDTGILLYGHNDPGKDFYPGLQNALVYGNHIVQRTEIGHRTSGISYYDPHGGGDDENLVYSANVFEITGSTTSPPSVDCISVGNGHLSEHHIYNDNVYQGTTTPVGITASGGHQPSFESGSVDSDLVADYEGLSVPDYSIPVYTATPPSD